MAYPTQVVNVGQQIPISWNPKDAAGNADTLDNPVPNFTSSNSAISTIPAPALNTDGNYVGYIQGLSAGSATITLTDTSYGVTLSEQVNVTVTPKDPAVTFGLTFGAPVPIPPPTA